MKEIKENLHKNYSYILFKLFITKNNINNVIFNIIDISILIIFSFQLILPMKFLISFYNISISILEICIS